MKPFTARNKLTKFPFYVITSEGYPCGVMVKSMDCGIIVSEFKL